MFSAQIGMVAGFAVVWAVLFPAGMFVNDIMTSSTEEVEAEELECTTSPAQPRKVDWPTHVCSAYFAGVAILLLLSSAVAHLIGW